MTWMQARMGQHSDSMTATLIISWSFSANPANPGTGSLKLQQTFHWWDYQEGINCNASQPSEHDISGLCE